MVHGTALGDGTAAGAGLGVQSFMDPLLQEDMGKSDIEPAATGVCVYMYAN